MVDAAGAEEMDGRSVAVRVGACRTDGRTDDRPVPVKEKGKPGYLSSFKRKKGKSEKKIKAKDEKNAEVR